MDENDYIVTLNKDICYFYHIQSEYKKFMPDLDFTAEFSLPYWSILKNISQDENFLKIGCILIILLMALDKIDGSGDSLSKKYPECKDAIESVIPYSENEKKLKDMTYGILESAKNSTSLSIIENEFLVWAYKEFIEGYFKRAIH